MQTRRRGISAVIDVFVMRFITVILYCMAVSISDKVHNRTIRIATESYIRKAVYLLILYIVVMLCVHFLYFFVSEQKGGSIGKWLVKYKTDYGKAEGRQAAVVALCKTAACVLYVITVLYYLFTGRMPYDKVRMAQCNTEDGV